jgi:hypothetical protein
MGDAADSHLPKHGAIIMAPEHFLRKCDKENHV